MGFLFLLILLLWIIFYLIITGLFNKRTRLRNRLESIGQGERTVVGEPEDQRFNERVMKPVLESIYSMIDRISPQTFKKQTEMRLRSIGKTDPRAFQQWVALRLILGVLLPVVSGIYALRLGMPAEKAFVLTMAPLLIIQILMSLYLVRRITERKNAIERQLPDVLDIITVSVEAGLSFDGAVERVVQKTNTELSAELGTTLKEMRMGKIRRQALRDLADRCDVSDVTTWVGAMIQADELGVGIGNVLRIQSVQMREKRRFRAREKSMKAPIKILFPLVMFIFPTLFIVLLGPAVINIIEMFKKM